ncbi:glycosyltransferase [Spirulina subsalsa FACHB-351]|uniref:Glycosyltransferase n=1 Tax=Spirulina subsalsa FACHB-351 TaxID=234711 RepID=A0ABT3L9V8_9CYAN|nr:glycosyltransferase [Spirulina subsalsa]MCW6038303.1 glycosyltransferase [Spirulina subsalsa FACHB-351]
MSIMLFDLSIRGHHPNYIRHLICYWLAQNPVSLLYIVVSPRFLAEHPEVVQLAHGADSIKFVAITSSEEDALVSRQSKWGRQWRNFQEWRLLQRYAKQLQVKHCVILYLDTYILYLALGLYSFCSLSGIYFRPRFHYSQWSDSLITRRDSLQMSWEKYLLFRVLNQPKFTKLLSLDPFVVDSVRLWSSSYKIVHIPDPVEEIPPVSVQRELFCQQWGIDPQRQIFLLFGALNGRKGVYPLLEAIAQLPDHLAQKLCLFLVGESNIVEDLNARIDSLCQNHPVQILRHYQFIRHSDVPPYFHLADVVLAPYQRHVGMSGILLFAAATQKPVLSSNYGLMGQIVERYELGLTIDSSQPSQIAQGLTEFLTDSSLRDRIHSCSQNQSEGRKIWGNPSKMADLVSQHSPERFAATVFHQLF